MTLTPEQIPLSLYVHMPWCVRKCPYCDFNSHEAAILPEKEYIDCLLADWQIELRHLETPRPLQSIFIGGGTPSLISPEGIERLLTQIKAQCKVAEDLEVTMEANPGTMEAGRFAGYFAAGVNRLSLGIQSFDDQLLQQLGRIHSAKKALQAVDIAKQAGFKRINLDLMHGLPNQTVAMALDDLQQAIDCQTEHLSWYQLTIEPNTIFYSKPPQLPADDTLWDIQQQGLALLQHHGFGQYEISAYARGEQARCRHNLNYWTFGDYLAIGAGAHGKITHQHQITRYHKKRIPKDYMHPDKAFLAKQTQIPMDELTFEFMMNALRLVDGVPMAFFEQRTGLDFAKLQSTLHELQQRDLLQKSDTHIQISEQGLLFLNDVLQAFID